MLVEPRLRRDLRGFFVELYNVNQFADRGLPMVFQQDNHCRSLKGALRGLHYQQRRPQGKLVSVIHGRIFDVAVDIRRGSPTFGQWFGTTLTSDDPRYMWIPPGFAHGFCALSDVADVVYKCTDVYIEDDDRGVLWSDPTIGIDWPIEAPLLSERDRSLPPLSLGRTDLPAYEP
jgi:dTDP-4-dehydrorhamnose 3,5-epimerase